MTHASDGISEKRLCELLGINRQNAETWRKRGLHKGGGKEKGYSELDAVALATVAALFEVLSPSDAPVAWLQVRDELTSRIPDGLNLVFDPREVRAELADGPEQLSLLVRLERPVVVVRIGERVKTLREALRRIARADAEFAGPQPKGTEVDRSRARR